MLTIDLRKTGPLLWALMATLSIGCGGGSDGPPADSSAAPPAESAGAGAAETAPPEAADEAAAEFWLGEARQDLQRFYGLYAEPDRPGRAWFAAPAKRPEWAEQAEPIPPGYLSLGAMFGDVAPFYMRSLSETEFVQARVPEAQGEAIRIRFELGPDGSAVAMELQGPYQQQRLERTGDLPEGLR